MKYEVINPKRHESGSLKGSFSVTDDVFEITGFTYFMNPQGEDWINMPSRKYQEEGKTKYVNTVFIKDNKRFADFKRWATEEARKLFDKLPAEKLDEPF